MPESKSSSGGSGVATIMVYKVIANWFGRIREMKRVMEDEQP